MRFEDNRTDKSRRVIAAFAQDLRSVGQIACERRLHIVYLMELRVCAGENRCVGWRRQGHLCIRPREAHRPSG